MKIDTALKLGMTGNLIYGFRSTWNPSGDSDVFFRPDEKPLKEFNVELGSVGGDWSEFPEVSFHSSAEDLLSAVFPFTAVPDPDDNFAPSIPAGPLLIGDKDRDQALKNLSKTLGVDLARAEHRYVLVKLRRDSGIVHHSGYQENVFVFPNPVKPAARLGVNAEFRREMTRLRAAQPSAEQTVPVDSVDAANRCIDDFGRFGTHFVSGVTVGDQIFQVFAYPSDQFAPIEKQYSGKTLSGRRAMEFAGYTTSAKTGKYGYVSEYGKILILSGDPALAQDLAKGRWNEPIFARGPSIFALRDPSTGMSIDDINKSYIKIAPIGIELSSLGRFVESNRRDLWRRVFKGCMYQKFAGIKPNFESTDPRNYDELLPQDERGLLSTIATPAINTYKQIIDLGELQMVAPEQVKEFTCFSNCLRFSGSKPATIPGTAMAILAQVVSLDSGGDHVLVLSDAAFDSYAFSCWEFHGGLLITNSAGSKRHAIVGGLRYVWTGPNREGRYGVRVDRSTRSAPDAAVLPRIRNSIEFAMAFAEAVLSDHDRDPDSALQLFVRDFLDWTASLVPDGTNDIAFVEIRMRARDLGRVSRTPVSGTFVPILPYGDYEETVKKIKQQLDEVAREIVENNRILAERRTQELVIDVGKTLNENIQQSGDRLVGFIDAGAQHAKDIASYYDSVIARTGQEFKSQGALIDQLEESVTQARSVVNTASANYKQAVVDWEKTERIKLGFKIAVSLFQIGASIAKEGEGAGEALSGAAERVQELHSLITGSTRLYTSDQKSGDLIKKIDKQLAEPGTLEVPADLFWDELLENFSAVMSLGQGEKDEVREKRIELERSFKVLVLRGRALLSAQAESQRLAREMYLQQRRKTINGEQAARLQQLGKDLHPSAIKDLDPAKIDVIGLTGNLQYMRNQMLAMLARAFAVQDRAMQYENLQPPTVIGSFSVLSADSAIVQQQQRSTLARESLRGVATTSMKVRYQVEKVLVDELSGGKPYRFSIQPDRSVEVQVSGRWHATTMADYVTAKIKNVDVVVEGIASTASGFHVVRVEYPGTLFMDRNLSGKPLFFRTLPRFENVEFLTDGNKRVSSGEGNSWSAGVSPVTPFSTWEISLPQVSKNKGLRFSGQTVTITLVFGMEARVVPVRGRKLKRGLFLAAAAEPPSKDKLIRDMNYQGSALNGWDVVFNMGLDQINDSLQKQYQELKKKKGNKIDIESRVQFREKRCDITRLQVEFGYPKMTFAKNNDGVAQLEMEILSGWYQLCDFPGKCQDADKDKGKIDCDPKKDAKQMTLTAIVPLERVEGRATGTGNKIYSIVLDFKKGSFSADKINLSDQSLVEFNNTLKAYFTNNPVQYVINTLDLTNIPTLEDLRPNEFVFRQKKTESGINILQLYIMTGSRRLSGRDAAILIDEPVPVGFNCSLMVSSERFFGSVVPQSARRGWTMAGKRDGASGKPNPAWLSEFTSGQLNGTGDFSGANGSTSAGNCASYTEFPKSHQITWQVNGMAIRPTASGKMQLSWSKQQQTTIPYTSTTVCPFTSRTTPRTATSDVALDVTAVLSMTVTGAARNQQVKIDDKSATLNVSGRMSGGGLCGCDDLQAQLNRELQRQIPPQMNSQLAFTFESVSLFALKNLLFPTDDFIDLKETYAPGDLLILGNFKS